MGRTTANSAPWNTLRHRSEPSARVAVIEAPPAEVRLTEVRLTEVRLTAARLTGERTPARRVE